MNTNDLSTCFCTNDIEACRQFYQNYFSAEAVFDCGWYLNLAIGENGQTIQFMQPQGDMPIYSGGGVTLNFKVDHVDTEFSRLMSEGLQWVMPLEDHPWGIEVFR